MLGFSRSAAGRIDASDGKTYSTRSTSEDDWVGVEALWTVGFGHAGGGRLTPINGGIVVLETGRVLGGDSFFSYVGSYEVSGHRISGRVHASRHNFDPLSTDAWEQDEDEFDLSFITDLNADETKAVGDMVRPGLPAIRLVLTRVAELP